MKTFKCGCTEMKPCAEHERESKMTVHDLGLIRRAILTVIDNGNREGDERGPWDLYNPDEAIANAHRMEFADAVQNYIVARIAPALKGEGA